MEPAWAAEAVEVPKVLFAQVGSGTAGYRVVKGKKSESRPGMSVGLLIAAFWIGLTLSIIARHLRDILRLLTLTQTQRLDRDKVIDEWLALGIEVMRTSKGVKG